LKDKKKPAIASCANTTKTVILEQRTQPKKKYVQVPKPLKKKISAIESIKPTRYNIF
jgi:hypothetical protein